MIPCTAGPQCKHHGQQLQQQQQQQLPSAQLAIIQPIASSTPVAAISNTPVLYQPAMPSQPATSYVWTATPVYPSVPLHQPQPQQQYQHYLPTHSLVPGPSTSALPPPPSATSNCRPQPNGMLLLRPMQHATPPAIRRIMQSYYADRASSRAQSEPDLRFDAPPAAAATVGYMDRRHPPRYFLALYDYDARHMSPNPNAIVEELSFRKGQIIKVYGSKDHDGFYHGELNGRLGLVPGNMVAEVGPDEIGSGLRDLRVSDGFPRSAYADVYLGASGRRRSELWPANSSDPALASYHRAPGFTDYDSSTSADRAGFGAALNPRLRRRLFSATKSRSLDYPSNDASARRVAMSGYRLGRSDYTPAYYDSDRERRYGEGPYSARAAGAPDYYYGRGSLDRRRDMSLPPGEEYRARYLDDPYYELGAPPEPLPLGDGYRRPPVRAMPAYPGAPYEDTSYPPGTARYPPTRAAQPYDPYGRGPQPPGAVAADPYYAAAAARQPLPGAAPTAAPLPTAGTARSFRSGGRDFLEQNIRDAVTTAPAKKMIAKFDYNPRELSPNVDAEQVELNFRANDVIVIYGEMDEDGFYIGELNGQRGLVPSNFLELFTGAGAALPTPGGMLGQLAQAAYGQAMSQMPTMPGAQQLQMGVMGQPGVEADPMMMMGGPGPAAVPSSQIESIMAAERPEMQHQGSLDSQQQQMMQQQQQQRGVTFQDTGAAPGESPPMTNGGARRPAGGMVPRQQSTASTGSAGAAGAPKPAVKPAAGGAKPAAGAKAGAAPAKKTSGGAAPAQRKTSQAPKAGAPAKKK